MDSVAQCTRQIDGQGKDGEPMDIPVVICLQVTTQHTQSLNSLALVIR
jgi:hypothetical protein